MPCSYAHIAFHLGTVNRVLLNLSQRYEVYNGVNYAGYTVRQNLTTPPSTTFLVCFLKLSSVLASDLN